MSKKEDKKTKYRVTKGDTRNNKEKKSNEF